MKNSVFLLIFLFSATLFSGEKLPELLKYLKSAGISFHQLESGYTCHSLETVLSAGLMKIKQLEEDVRSSRKRVRIAAILPKLTAWSKYKNDEKTYLYQQNNISVGKDYITVGPDDNNTTLGSLDTYEIGGRLEFNLSKLIYNPDSLRFSQEEHKIYAVKKQILEQITLIYYHTAIVNALLDKKIDIPQAELIAAQIENAAMRMWFKELTGMELNSCRKRQ